ncbi:PLP-dependent transferase [Paraphaeosphaeria sporulosa]|uniref:PLP-dependent transferase n=1 Tax=Paraphaeosphaeria sporulosa TaxID=1460663 RepID=A0A177CAB2_9PLEO|nr:PLP-dependent transferase [Paraphaeosphaeria sporulosa]OAG04593.1 PLP-dependent transferase [Paraphaeosphaeria sporulosa]
MSPSIPLDTFNHQIMHSRVGSPQHSDVKADPGLSSRMRATLKALAPTPHDVASQAFAHDSTTIDLSTAQSELIRPELLEFLKTLVEDKMTEKTFAAPAGDGGDASTRESLASFFNKSFNPIHTVKPEHIVLTAGASDALESVIHAICDEGDSVIVPGPYWFGFERITRTRQNVNIVVARPPTYQNFDNYLLPSIQAAYDFTADKSRIKAVLICNPNNPTSRCYTRKSLIECMEFCQERGLHFISDEIYALTALNDTPPNSAKFVSALSLTEPLVPEGAVKIDPSRVHVIWAASKLFGSSGFRIGCLISQQNPKLLSALSLLTYWHANTLASLYLSHLLTWPQLPTLIALNSERLTASYRLLATALQQLDVSFVTPTDGIFVFAKLAKHAQNIEDEQDFFHRLALQGILLGPGNVYKGVERDFGWTRVRFSIPVKVMEVALERITTFVTMEG